MRPGTSAPAAGIHPPGHMMWTPGASCGMSQGRSCRRQPGRRCPHCLKWALSCDHTCGLQETARARKNHLMMNCGVPHEGVGVAAGDGRLVVLDLPRARSGKCAVVVECAVHQWVHGLHHVASYAAYSSTLVSVTCGRPYTRAHRISPFTNDAVTHVAYVLRPGAQASLDMFPLTILQGSSCALNTRPIFTWSRPPLLLFKGEESHCRCCCCRASTLCTPALRLAQHMWHLGFCPSGLKQGWHQGFVLQCLEVEALKPSGRLDLGYAEPC